MSPSTIPYSSSGCRDPAPPSCRRCFTAIPRTAPRCAGNACCPTPLRRRKHTWATRASTPSARSSTSCSNSFRTCARNTTWQPMRPRNASASRRSISAVTNISPRLTCRATTTGFPTKPISCRTFAGTSDSCSISSPAAYARCAGCSSRPSTCCESRSCSRSTRTRASSCPTANRSASLPPWRA